MASKLRISTSCRHNGLQ